MSRNPRMWKKWVRVALASLLLLDVALLVVNWRAGAGGLEARHGELEKLRRTHNLLAADVRRGMEIRRSLPDVQRECERFYTKQMLEAATGYSAIVADLGDIAGRAGLRPAVVNFKQRDLEGRGVVQVEINAVLEGDYTSLVRFINGLERSEHFYLLDSLTLAASAPGGAIRLNLQLRTYFRA